jgi:hypothetical protein
MVEKPAGRGQKRHQLNVLTDNLLLDPLNPRLPKEARGKAQELLVAALRRDFNLDELAYSISGNGYFDEEPVVAIPISLPKKFETKKYEELIGNKDYIDFISDPKTQFYVAEGNRRLSTIKILLSSKLRSSLRIQWPELTENVAHDISILPAIIYPTRREVLPYLGVRHITGITKWEAYEKADYVDTMVKQGYTIDQIQLIVGDRTNNIKKIYQSYKIVEEAQEELGMETTEAKDSFSLLTLATGQGSIKTYIGLPKKLDETDFEQPVPVEKQENLRNLMGWLFGDGDKLPVLKESRDITNFLGPVLSSPTATEHLILTRDLQEAYDMSSGEEMLLSKKLTQAKRALGYSLKLISGNKSEAVIKLVNDCEQTIKDIKKLLK